MTVTPKVFPRVALIMGSSSDWETMQHCANTLDSLGIAHHDEVVSAHRTPIRMVDFARGAETEGFEVIIACAGGAAHLPGMTASLTTLPVIGVPAPSRALQGIDSLLSIVQMPGGVPVATMAIGKPGAINAAHFAARILGVADPEARAAESHHLKEQAAAVLAKPNPSSTP